MASQRVVPALRVLSYVRSEEFYRKLGFQESWRHQDSPSSPIFASLVADGMEIFLTEHSGDCAFGGLVHFYVPDVDKCSREFLASGIALAEPPGNALGPNTRDMLIVDPDGNRLSFITLSDSKSPS